MANNIYKDCFDSGFNKVLDLSSVELTTPGTIYYFEIESIEKSKLIEILDGLTFIKINFNGFIFTAPVAYGLNVNNNPIFTVAAYSEALNGVVKFKGLYVPTDSRFELEATV